MLDVRDIFKNYERQPLLQGVSFTVSAGETVCLLGASGSGKSTLLRIIAGLEQADGGQVLWNGEDLSTVPVHRRHFGLMFQDYALFPHRSVAENVAFGLRMQGLPADDIKKRTVEALDRVKMGSFSNRRVTDLSGGEQQRVALARALAPNPNLLMLDEPLGALDRALRAQLLDDLRKLLHHSGMPAIYVTHDQEEAFAIADRLILLHDGRIAQNDSPVEVFSHPSSAWAARFLGFVNLIPGRIVGLKPLQVETALGTWLSVEPPPSGATAGNPVMLLLKPDGAVYADSGQDENVVEGVVQDVLFRGEGFRIDLLVGEMELQFFVKQPAGVGDRIRLRIDPRAVVCLA